MSSPNTHDATVIHQTELAPGTFELTFTRAGLHFQAGHEIQIHGRDATENRTYSLSSGETDEHLQILYRVIPEGVLTPQLARLKPGDPIGFTGPFGNFLLRDKNGPIVFMATGTGIAPAISFMRTYPDLHLRLLHGVRTTEDLVYRDSIRWWGYDPCTSREDGPGIRGRLTQLLPSLDLDPATQYYLCGSNDMILEAGRMLRDRGVHDSHIFAEAYYYW